MAFALGADMVNVAREAMMSIGCIQSQKCHTDHCPTGVATQNPWLARGLDPVSKAERCAQYIRTFRKEMVKVTEAVGVAHPGLITAEDVDVFCGDYEARSLRDVYGYQDGWGTLGAHLAREITELMAPGGSRPRRARSRSARARSRSATTPRPRPGSPERRLGPPRRPGALGVGRLACRRARRGRCEAQWATSFSETVLRIARIRRVRSFGSAW